jgi:predicted nucleotidyltransferase
VLPPRFRPDSDVDVLVEFDAGHTPGLLTLAGMEIELSKIFGRSAGVFLLRLSLPPCRNRNAADRIRIRHMLDAAVRSFRTCRTW